MTTHTYEPTTRGRLLYLATEGGLELTGPREMDALVHIARRLGVPVTDDAHGPDDQDPEEYTDPLLIERDDLIALVEATALADVHQLLPACPSDPCPTCTAMQSACYALGGHSPTAYNPVPTGASR